MTPEKAKIIKRYQNRKLYDTSQSRYVTLNDIADMIKSGEDVKIIDNQSKEDLTSLTLTQIIFEQEKKKKSLLPLTALRDIIQSGPSQVMDFVTSKADEVVHSISQAREEAEDYLEKMIKKGDLSLEEMRQLLREFVNNKIKPKLGSVSNLPNFQAEVRQMRKKIEDLEKKLKQYEK
jgi:polyhydroxyalkanoate synthesis repressor PhaR